MTRTALVTGYRGFVGRHLAAELSRRGYCVIGCDLVDGHDVREYFLHDDERYDLVVHCAAVVGGRTMIDGRPLTLAAEDLSLDALMFRWAERTRPHRIVYFSSSAAYPVSLQDGDPPMPLREGHIDLQAPELPDQTYGWVKLTGERLAAEANAAGIHTHVFRPFSGYGTDQATDYPFPTFLARARDGSPTFEVWGDGTQVRDFVHIDDIVDTVMAAIDGRYLDPVNIGTGGGTSFNELADMCMREAGTVRPIQHLRDKPVGVQYRVAHVAEQHELHTPRWRLEDVVRSALRGAP
jgi:nucleoside-diphosphate-sugar epimerase